MKHSSDNPSMDLQQAAKGSEVFVGGLPITITETKIREIFSSCGEIVELRLIKDITGKPKGYCFVRFSMKEAATRAIKEKSGFVLEGRKIGVLPSTEQYSLFFGNICKDWTADDFSKLVHQAFQDVVSVVLAMSSKCEDDSLSQKSKNRGFAFVKFASHAAASRAYRVGSKADFMLGGNWHPSVEWAQEDPEVDPEESAKVKVAFVRNLPVDADEEYLRKLFEPFGKVEKVVLSKKIRSAVGFVHFDKRSDLDHAVAEMNEKTIQGPKRGPEIKIEVEVAKPMDKAKKRTRDESQKKPTSNPYNFSGGNNSKALKLEPQAKEVHAVDPFEAAVILLPVAVKERLLRILQLGVASRFDFDIQFLTSLSDLPESAAISVLDQFLISGADKYDKGAFLAGLVSKYKVDKVLLSPKFSHLSRSGDIVIRDPVLTNLVNRARLPATDSVVSVAGRVAPRYDVYTNSPVLPRYPSELDHRIPHEIDARRMEETSPAHAFQHGSPVSYHRIGIDSHLSPPAARQPVSSPGYVRRQQPVPSMIYDRAALDPHADRHPAPSTSYGRVGLDSYPAQSAASQPARTQQQLRFDPFTGEPYKFDPFTGEPIQH